MKISSKQFGHVSTFDSGGSHPISFCEANVDKRMHRGGRELYGPLPNVPLAARQTILAETLRTGSFLQKILGFRKTRRIENLAEHMRDNACFTSLPAIKKAKLGKLIGVEVEYMPRNGENNVPKESVLCNTTHDGSLSPGGREIRKLTWANSEGRLSGLLALRIDGHVDKKCSVHVHIDVRHLTVENNRLTAEQTHDRLFALSFAFKKLIPKSRRNNSYCRFRNSRESGERYCAINYQSVAEHGSLEFRMQGGSTNVLKIECWALLCAFLVDYASKPDNTMPRTWKDFLTILPEPFKTWCYLRAEALYGTPVRLDERTMSAVSGVE